MILHYVYIICTILYITYSIANKTFGPQGKLDFKATILLHDTDL